MLFLNDAENEDIVYKIFNRIKDYLKKVNFPKEIERAITVSAWAKIVKGWIKKNEILKYIWEADEKLYISKKNWKNQINV